MRAGLTGEADWAADVQVRLDRRLNAPDGAPVVLALSGGGDSLALLLLAHAWGERHGRRIVALTVDHGLQAQSAAWAEFAMIRARRLNVEHRTLLWVGEKPARGLPAVARAARHALLAEAAWNLGARVALLAHTADDVLEAAEMRRQGATTPTPLEWSPSPAWPEGRGVFLLRPLLEVRRAALRAMLAELGETWIEDPANDDQRFSRARARRWLAEAPAATPTIRDCPTAARRVPVEAGLAGELRVSRRELIYGPAPARWLSAMILCASGGRRPPRGASVRRLVARLAAGDDFTATVAGARIEARGDTVMACREAGERARGAMPDAPLPVGVSVFDGRFLVTAGAAGFRIGPLGGRAKGLPRLEKSRLTAVPAGARGALPVVISPVETLSCPILAQDGSVSARPLGLERLQAALGAFEDEAALWCVAKSPSGA